MTEKPKIKAYFEVSNRREVFTLVKLDNAVKVTVLLSPNALCKYPTPGEKMVGDGFTTDEVASLRCAFTIRKI